MVCHLRDTYKHGQDISPHQHEYTGHCSPTELLVLEHITYERLLVNPTLHIRNLWNRH